MKKRILFAAFALLTVCGVRSQDTTNVRPICFPFWMVKEIALDLVEKSRLEANEKLSFLETSSYKSLVKGLEINNSHKDLQLQLLQKNNQSLEVQLLAEKTKRPGNNSFIWMLRLLGALGAGYVLGSF